MRKFKFVSKIFIAVLILALTFTSCGTNDEEVKTQAEQAFAEAMEAFKAGDADKINEYCKYANISDESELRSIILSSLKNVSYNINSVTANSSKSATIDVDITLIDASQVMSKYVENIVELVSSSEYQSKIDTMTKEDYDEMMNEELSEILQSGEIPNVTQNLSIIMVKEDGSWKVDGSELSQLLVTNTLDAITMIKQ